MQIQFATKKVMGAYEVAVIVDGKFKRSGAGQDVLVLLTKLVGPIIASVDGEGTEIAVNIAALTAAEVEREEARDQRVRQTQQAEAEAQAIERLTAAVKREKEARAAGTVEAHTEQQ